MRLTHKLALAALFAGAAAFAQGSGDATSKSGTSNAPSSTQSSGSMSTTGTSGSVGTDQGTGASTRPSTSDTGMAGSSATRSSTGVSTGTAATATAMTPVGVLSMLQQVDKDELKLAQMAQSKASSDKVKDYAKDMIKDHDALDKKVSEFATKNKLTLAPSHIPADKRIQLTDMVQDAERRLGSATGAQFDREYMQTMSQSHGSVLANLDAALPSLKAQKNQEKVYDLVKTARDKVEDHKKHADDILRDLSKSEATGGSGMSGSTGSSTGGSSYGTTGSSTRGSGPSGQMDNGTRSGTSSSGTGTSSSGSSTNK